MYRVSYDGETLCYCSELLDAYSSFVVSDEGIRDEFVIEQYNPDLDEWEIIEEI